MSGISPERWAEVEALYWQLLERPGKDRRTALQHVRVTDPELADEVEALLAEDATDPGFLDAPAAGRPEAPSGAEAHVRIGPYRVVRPLGRGGMGEVFLAVDETEGVRRHVALKVVRKGLDSEELLRRFRRERRILASLAHPAIARLLQVGTARDGRP